MGKRRARWSPLTAVLLVLNVMTTSVTLFTGLREDPIVSKITGRYSSIRQRFHSGSINQHIVEPDMFLLESVASPQQLADYRFITTPKRNLETFGEDTSVCKSINSNAAPVMLSSYNDFWGHGPRRLQIVVYSISAPRCDVLNARPDWRAQCVADRDGNATRCHEFVLEHFESLRQDLTIRTAGDSDLGASGVLFLRCFARPLLPVEFKADRVAHEAYWNDGDFHATIETSRCLGSPLVRSRDLRHTLFEVSNAGDTTNMYVLLPPNDWFGLVVFWSHSFVKLACIFHGISLALLHKQTVAYLPSGLRYARGHAWLRYAMPFMDNITKVSGATRSIIAFKGTSLFLSDFWITHWLYLWLCMLESAINIRATYVLYHIASSLLIKRITFESVVYLCHALTKLTWVMCLVQTVLRFALKAAVRCVRSLRLIRLTACKKIERTVDSMGMFLSYRVYYILLFLITITLTYVKGDPSFMVRATPYKIGSYGGLADIAGFWGSEVACDLVTLLALLTGVGHVLGILMLCTRYKYVANNSVMRFLQQRYGVAGWDGLLAAEMLGLDPHDDDVVVGGVAYTKASVGSLLQLLYQSGPSGFVQFAGDYIFHFNAFSKQTVKFSYSIPKATEMGLFDSGTSSSEALNLPSAVYMSSRQKNYVMPGSGLALDAMLDRTGSKTSIFERRMRLVSDGYFGKLLFIEAKIPGRVVVNAETGQREYGVVDSLTTISILDIKYLLGTDKKLRIQ